MKIIIDLILLILCSIVAFSVPNNRNEQWEYFDQIYHYRDNNGDLVKDKWITGEDKKEYYFDGNGELLENTITPDGNLVSSLGEKEKINNKYKRALKLYLPVLLKAREEFTKVNKNNRYSRSEDVFYPNNSSYTKLEPKSYKGEGWIIERRYQYSNFSLLDFTNDGVPELIVQTGYNSLYDDYGENTCESYKVYGVLGDKTVEIFDSKGQDTRTWRDKKQNNYICIEDKTSGEKSSLYKLYKINKVDFKIELINSFLYERAGKYEEIEKYYIISPNGIKKPLNRENWERDYPIWSQNSYGAKYDSYDLFCEYFGGDNNIGNNRFNLPKIYEKNIVQKEK